MIHSIWTLIAWLDAIMLFKLQTIIVNLTNNKMIFLCNLDFYSNIIFSVKGGQPQDYQPTLLGIYVTITRVLNWFLMQKEGQDRSIGSSVTTSYSTI